MVYSTPVSSYYKNGLQPIDVEVTHYHRAVPHGTGHIQAVSNYAGGLLAGREAKERGFDGWCVPRRRSTERPSRRWAPSNLFCVIDGRVLTPQKGSILPGITRASVLEIARVEFGLPVEETRVLVPRSRKGERSVLHRHRGHHPSDRLDYPRRAPNHLLRRVGSGRSLAAFPIGLTAIQTGAEPDPYGWVVPVDVAETPSE